MNRSWGREIGIQATVRTCKSLNVVFRPLPQTTRYSFGAMAAASFACSTLNPTI